MLAYQIETNLLFLKVNVMSSRSVIEISEECLRGTDDLQVLFNPAAEPSRSGEFRPLSESSLCSNIVEYLSERFHDGLYTHQHDAIESVLAGNNTVVATRTSSGKSLIYSLPAFHTVCEDPNATTLFLYPQKALANDQLLKLREMAAEIPCVANRHAGKEHFVSRYDGSTDSNVRPAIREQVQLMLTNPDMLHFSVLQHHENHWARFFRNLKLVAIDECHEYRGIFGTNVSHILHRLRQLCHRYGSDPRFIATSATVSDPQQHMELLTGVPFSCVDPDRDGSQQGRRKFWMVNSAEHYLDTGRKVALQLAEAGLSVLAFCPTRVSAEQMVSRLERGSEEKENSFVRVYRSGLSADEREEIECGLRDRSVRLVFSTSALELGIDIGAIDVVISIGLPHSMMSLWQRAGRSARGGRDGVTIFIPADTPIDSWYAAHPEELFGRDHEPLVLNRTNQRLLCLHYACAVQEAGGDADHMDLQTLGSEICQIHELRESGQLDRDEFYRAEPHMEVSVRGMGEGSYDLMIGRDKLGEIDSLHLIREACRNAIYRHGGRAYRVIDVIRGKRLVSLRPVRTFNETRPHIVKKIKVRQTIKSRTYADLRLAHATLNVTEYLNNVTERNPRGQVVQNWPGSMGMPPHQLPTEGTMLTLRAAFWNDLKRQMSGRPESALHALERLMRGLFPTISGPCDTQDFSSATDTVVTGEPAIFLYDAVYDGVGLTETAFHYMLTLIERSQERLRNCDCQDQEGCFRCIRDPQKEQPANKADTLLLIDAVRRTLGNEQPEVIASGGDCLSSMAQTAGLKCSQCAEPTTARDRFCANCGFKLQA